MPDVGSSIQCVVILKFSRSIVVWASVVSKIFKCFLENLNDAINTFVVTLLFEQGGVCKQTTNSLIKFLKSPLSVFICLK